MIESQMEKVEKLRTIFKKSGAWAKRSSTGWIVSGVELEEEEALPIMLELLKEEDRRVTASVSYTLRVLGSQAITKAAPELFKVMQAEKDAGVRAHLAWTLGTIRFKEAEEPIKYWMREEQNKREKFEFARALARIEGKEGEGIAELQRMKDKGKLTEWQIREFEGLCRELELKEGVVSVGETVKTVKQLGESQLESEEKQKLLEKISLLEEEVKSLQDKIAAMSQDPRKLHQRQLVEVLQDLDKEDLTSERRAELLARAEVLKMTGEVLPPRPQQPPQKETKWEKWGGEIIGAIIGALVGAILSFVVTYLVFRFGIG